MQQDVSRNVKKCKRADLTAVIEIQIELCESLIDGVTSRIAIQGHYQLVQKKESGDVESGGKHLVVKLPRHFEYKFRPHHSMSAYGLFLCQLLVPTTIRLNSTPSSHCFPRCFLVHRSHSKHLRIKTSFTSQTPQ